MTRNVIGISRHPIVLFSFLLLLFTTGALANPNEKDSVTLKTFRGHFRDFDGDGQLDTLYLTQQNRERKGKATSSRFIPGFIVWGDTVAKKTYDTTVLDLPKETDVVIGFRLEDFNDDKIYDIEILYRWLDTSQSNGSVNEKIWMVSGGESLREEKIVKLSNAKQSLATANTILSERHASTRDEEQPLGIGGYAFRRIRSAAQEKPKRRTDADVESSEVSLTLEVFPNPAHDVVHVRIVGKKGTHTSTIEILDLNGRSVVKQTSPGESELDVRSLVSGTYSVRLIGCDVCPAVVQFQIAR